MASTTKLPKDYENNPFFIATKGISLLFNTAQGVAIILVVVSVLSAFSGNWSDTNTEPADAPNAIMQSLASWSANEWFIAIFSTVIIVLALMLLGALFGGVSAYTSAQLARGKSVSVGEAFRQAFDKLWSFLWLQIIVLVKVLLWSLLLIVPGIIMSVRYSLAGTAFFDKELRGNAAIKESLRLTKGAWLTTFAGGMLLNYLTFGLISLVVSTGANAVLYRQFDKLDDKKPEAHWLSWLTLVIPFILIALLILFLAFLAIAIGVIGKIS